MRPFDFFPIEPFLPIAAGAPQSAARASSRCAECGPPTCPLALDTLLLSLKSQSGDPDDLVSDGERRDNQGGCDSGCRLGRGEAGVELGKGEGEAMKGVRERRASKILWLRGRQLLVMEGLNVTSFSLFFSSSSLNSRALCSLRAALCMASSYRNTEYRSGSTRGDASPPRSVRTAAHFIPGPLSRKVWMPLRQRHQANVFHVKRPYFTSQKETLLTCGCPEA
eukprot:474658-Prorocentrum_minimum.AAC.3